MLLDWFLEPGLFLFVYCHDRSLLSVVGDEEEPPHPSAVQGVEPASPHYLSRSPPPPRNRPSPAPWSSADGTYVCQSVSASVVVVSREEAPPCRHNRCLLLGTVLLRHLGIVLRCHVRRSGGFCCSGCSIEGEEKKDVSSSSFSSSSSSSTSSSPKSAR